jgi:hypothetical protein
MPSQGNALVAKVALRTRCASRAFTRPVISLICSRSSSIDFLSTEVTCSGCCSLFHIDCGIAFDIFLAVRSVVGACTGNKIDIVADNSSVPCGQQKFWKCALPYLVGSQRRD